MSEGDGREGTCPLPNDRGQLVLLAAAIVALALVPILLAYAQLGYHDDVRSTDGYTAPVEDAERTLERAVYGASGAVDGEYRWGERRDAAETAREELEPRLIALEESRFERGTVYRVEYNDTAAGAHAASECPNGEGKQFGPCQAEDGVVLQQRAGEVHLLAVAFDLTVTSQDGETEVTVLVGVIG